MKSSVSFVFEAAAAGFSINTKRIWSRRCAMGSTNSAVTPNAAVNHTRIRAVVHPPAIPSEQLAVLRGENSWTIDLSEMTSAGFGVSAIAPALAVRQAPDCLHQFPVMRDTALPLPDRRPDGRH